MRFVFVDYGKAKIIFEGYLPIDVPRIHEKIMLEEKSVDPNIASQRHYGFVKEVEWIISETEQYVKVYIAEI